MKVFVPAALMLGVLSGLADAADLRIVGRQIYLSPANSRGYVDLTLDAAVVAAGARQTIRVESLRVDLMQGGVAKQSRIYQASELVASTLGLVSAGFDGALQSQLLDPHGLVGILGRPTTLSNTPILAPSTALVLSSQYFVTTFEPDAVRVSVTYRDERQLEETLSLVTPVVRYASPLVYRAPLQGSWFESSLPSLTSHHRFNPSTAFAVDFFKIDEHGAISSGDRSDAAHYFGYGAPVLAAADGVVVHIVDDQVQDRLAMLPHEGEASQHAGQRIGRYMQQRMERDFRAASAGNLIVIRHQSGQITEYSAYGHLRTGSARVMVGQTVHQGEVIAEVGDTGDSPSVHLHFQVNAGDDPFTSQSLPIQFIDLPRFPGSELGRIVTPGE